MQNVPNIVRDRLKVATPVSHPDADTLTAFSERLLPKAEHTRILEHLARCGECREVVALALPAIETVQPVLGSSGSRWLAWPTLRWAFVVAGVAIASLGVVEYQHHVHNPTMMAYRASSAKAEAVAKNTQALPVVTTPHPARDHGKQTAALVAKNEAAPAGPSPEKARTSGSRRYQFHGSGYGASLGGPASSIQARGQWQQQNTGQNQVAVSTPPSETAAEVSGAAPSTFPQAAQFNAQLAKNQPVPALSGDSAGFAVDKAKLPVPPASPADGMLNRPSPQDRFPKLSPQPVPGEIGGYVVDPSGAVVSNARITITPSQTGGTATAITNSQGAWLIAGLSSGSYKAQAEAPGFKTTILDLNYDANQPAMFSFTLSPGSVSETVEVSSAQMQVQTDGTPIGGPVTGLAVSPSPARALNFEQATSLSPAPRWSVGASGTLQRSFDQGNTWQDVNVSGAPMAFVGSNLDISADTQSAKDAKVARAKTRAANKKDAASPVFRAVIANGPDVWAGGLHGSLYHSTDSGNHWMQVVPSSAGSVLTGDIVSIVFTDPQHAKVLTSTDQTWVTADSGQTWQKQ